MGTGLIFFVHLTQNKEILEDYPHLTKEDIQAALLYVGA